MSRKKARKKVPKPTAAEIQKKKEEAAKKLAEQIKADQAWVDSATEDMTDDEKNELFRQLSASCKGATYADGKIVLACPIKPKLVYCMGADKFDCPDGNEGKGCKLSPEVSKAIKSDNVCIDAVFVSKEEGGSYPSPYVPWGPIGRDKKGRPVVTEGNNSGVTIGTGVDLGAMKPGDLAKLKAMGVSKETLDKLTPLIGKKRAEACKALRDLKQDKPLVLDSKDVQLIDQYAFQKRVLALKKQFDDDRDKYIAGLQRQINKENKKKKPDTAKIEAWQEKIDNAKGFDDLSCADQSVLFSTYYHEGSVNKAHMKGYTQALIDGDAEAAQKAIESKTRNPNPLIAARGKEELQYLIDHRSPPPPPTNPPDTAPGLGGPP
jgi:hypothetical protein